MPKATRQSAHVTNTEALQANELWENSNPLQDASSEYDEVVIQSPQFQPSMSQTQVVQPMYMPYVLYHRFLKWKIKCENILDCELAMLSEARKCKKIVAWSGDFGIDQTVSSYLPLEDLYLEVI